MLFIHLFVYIRTHTLTHAHTLIIIYQRAFNALCHSTHLYGRRLVLEWAEEEEDIDELRKKTASHFRDGLSIVISHVLILYTYSETSL